MRGFDVVVVVSFLFLTQMQELRRYLNHLVTVCTVLDNIMVCRFIDE